MPPKTNKKNWVGLKYKIKLANEAQFISSNVSLMPPSAISGKYLLFILVGFWMISCSSSGPEGSPNIIFFIADDMYPEMFNCLPEGNGKNLTPHLDRLAKEGTLLVNQYVVSPVCTPSRFNCLTGKYASRARNNQFLRKTEAEGGQTVIQWNTFITQNDSILPHYLKALGYTTGMAGKNHVIEAGPIYQFPDYYADPREPEIAKKVEDNYLKVRQAILNSGFDYADGIYHNNPNFIGLWDLAVQNLDWTTAAGLDFIDRNHGNPFFLYFATTVPHGPNEADRSWNADPAITARGILESPPEVMPERHTLPERIRDAGLQGKQKENVLWLDDALGALIDRLEAYDILENTIIFFFNDHGQHAKGTLYQGGVHNPSIVWRPAGFPCGKVCEAKVSNVDFVPTILEMAGATELPDGLDGISFLGVLNGSEQISRESLYFELGYARGIIHGDYKYIAVRYPPYALRWGREELAGVLENYNSRREATGMVIVNRDPEKPFSHLEVVPGGGAAEHESYGAKPGYFDQDQLYHLSEDPSEMINLAGDPDYQDILNQMKAHLQEYLEALPGKFEL
jgi:arylsulfatase A-like enzyme